MPRTWKVVAAGGIAVVALAVSAVWPWREASPPASPASRTEALAARPVAPSTATIEALERRVQAAPKDWQAAAALGTAYVQRASTTGDPSDYRRAERVLEQSLAAGPDPNGPAMAGMGVLALGRHRFDEALLWGDRLIVANPSGSVGYGIVGDALLELGRYEEAFRTIQRMVDARPGLASYARAAYARELQGDTRGAVRLMRMAERAAGSPPDAAWAAHELADLLWSSEGVGPVETAFRRAVALSPDFPPARAGLAEVRWAQGRVREAIRLYRDVVERYPTPEHAAALGDLLAAVGRRAEARAAFDVVRTQHELLRSSGVVVDLEVALFEADHGRPRAALRSARAAWRARPSIHAADAMAWALFANGRFREADRFAGRALHLGTADPLLRYHAGMIALRLGDRNRARARLGEALRSNPWFSILHASRAERALARLEAMP